MAAGLGFKTFTTGEVLTAGDVNGYLMQGINVFTNAAARDAAITSPEEGQCCYLKDTDAVLTYSGVAWVGFDDTNAIQNAIVDAKGDLIAASANDTPARLAVGSDGETLVADSSTSTGLAYAPTFFAGKNKVINGNFNVWQRGTSFSLSSATWTFVSDRWQVYQGFSAGACTVSQQAFTAGAAPAAPYESQYFLRIQTATTNTSSLNFRQLIEDVRTLANQSVTVSFWAKASSAITDLQVDLRQNFGSGGSASVDTLTSPFAITTSWVRYTKTLTNPSISGKTIGTGSALEIYFQTPTNLANGISIDFWGVQVESGTSATSFQTATGTIQGELAACQRYYYRQGGDSAYQAMSAYSNAVSTIAVDPIVIPLPVTMRVEPTVLDTNAIGVSDGVNAIITGTFTLATQDSKTAGQVKFVGSGLTQYRGYVINANNSTSAYVGLGAEL
jgi:hypothetical protein